MKTNSVQCFFTRPGMCRVEAYAYTADGAEYFCSFDHDPTPDELMYAWEHGFFQLL